MSVLMMPGFRATAAIPEGSSCAKAWVSPSIAYLVAQYGATSGSVERPQPELKFTRDNPFCHNPVRICTHSALGLQTLPNPKLPDCEPPDQISGSRYDFFKR